MGLDIDAYSRCRFVAPKGDDEDWDKHYEAGHVYVYVLDSFRDRLDGLLPGWYAVTGSRRSFRAGSYTGYNHWRQQLSRAALGVDASEVWANPIKFDGMPFVELIDFADNEGCIGPKTSAKLAADFDAFPYLPSMVPDDLGYFGEKYKEWREAFALAADDGLVSFG